MLPRDRAYGLASTARDGRHGRGGRVRVYSRTYGLATAAGDRRYDTQAVGRANKQSVGWAVAVTAGRPPPPAGRPPAAAGRPPATAGDQSVVYERENRDYILYKKKIKKRGKESKANGRVYKQEVE